MKLNLPRLQNLSDVRKYLMVIESLEINKLNNAISVNANMNTHAKGIKDLRTLKQYYGDLTEFLFKKQTESRLDEFEQVFINQLEDFLKFWQVIMTDFKQLYDEELERVLEKNDELKGELNEMLEKSLGFKAPPNALFLNLLAIRKLAFKLKNDESTQFLNFDFFKRYNQKINQDWVKDRRSLIITRLEQFERRLAECTETIKYKLNLELAKLHSRRLKMYDKLMVKYGKIKRNVESVNNKELQELRRLKEFFIAKHAIPVYYHSNELFKNGIVEDIAKGSGQADNWEPILPAEPEEPVSPVKGNKVGATIKNKKDADSKVQKGASKDKVDKGSREQSKEKKNPKVQAEPKDAKGKPASAKKDAVSDKKQAVKA